MACIVVQRLPSQDDVDLQVAIRSHQLGVAYFHISSLLPASVQVRTERLRAAALWAAGRAHFRGANEVTQKLPIIITSLEGVRVRLGAAALFVMAHKWVTADFRSHSSSCALGAQWRGFPVAHHGHHDDHPCSNFCCLRVHQCAHHKYLEATSA